jgi:putative transposase
MDHCISWVVDRRFVFDELEQDKFRVFMRMQENFSGCRILSYCLMSNHFHLLLEMPPMPVGGIADEELLKRLLAIYNEAEVAVVAKELSQPPFPRLRSGHRLFQWPSHQK